jgi:hypothetical protein
MQLMSLKDFRDKGYLQEVNRRFLHPLGLGLGIAIRKEEIDDENEQKYFLVVVEALDDPEGMLYPESMMEKEKAVYINERWVEKAKTRMEELGYIIQPVEAEMVAKEGWESREEDG